MDWYSTEKFEKSLLSIKFTGDELEHHGVSIYDLSECLLALQRIIHKAHLAQENRLYKGSYPKKEIREKLALQLGSRKKGSDLFALVPLIADPNINEALRKAFDYVISGVVGYYTGDVIERLKNEKDDNKNQPEMKKIVLKPKIQDKKPSKQAQMNGSKKDQSKNK